MVVIRMGPNPEPDHRVPVPHREGPIAQTHTGGINRALWMHGLEAQARVLGIVTKQALGETGLVLHLRRECGEGFAKPLGGVGGQSVSASSALVRPARCSASASSASCSSAW